MNEQQQDWTARTQSMVLGATRGHLPSQRALATRSLTAADRLTGEARSEALREHFDRFMPPPQRACPVRR